MSTMREMIKMPISCANCSHTYGGYCNLTGKDFEDELSRRNKDCPLEESEVEDGK